MDTLDDGACTFPDAATPVEFPVWNPLPMRAQPRVPTFYSAPEPTTGAGAQLLGDPRSDPAPRTHPPRPPPANSLLVGEGEYGLECVASCNHLRVYRRHTQRTSNEYPPLTCVRRRRDHRQQPNLARQSYEGAVDSTSACKQPVQQPRTIVSSPTIRSWPRREGQAATADFNADHNTRPPTTCYIHIKDIPTWC